METAFCFRGAYGGDALMEQNKLDEQYMTQALGLAQKAFEHGEVPVGAVVVRDQQVIGEGWNCPILRSDPSAHAEVVALREACLKVGNYRLPGATLYVTIEPCAMCVGVLMHARIQRLVYGATEPKAGAVCSHLQLPLAPHWNHTLQVSGGLLAEQSAALIQGFFALRRAEKKQLKAADKPQH